MDKSKKEKLKRISAKLYYVLLAGFAIWGGIILSFVEPVAGVLLWLTGVGVVWEFYAVVRSEWVHKDKANAFFESLEKMKSLADEKKGD